MSARTALFSFHDNSKLYSVSAKWLIEQPVWEGNRTRDDEHVKLLRRTITDPRQIEGPFVLSHMLTEEGDIEYRLMDGQHRAEVLRQYFANGQPDFQVLVRQVFTRDEQERINLFRILNTQKPIHYELSPEHKRHALLTRLQTHFQTTDGRKSVLFIRNVETRRPFLSSGALLDAFRKAKLFEDGGDVDATFDTVLAKNTEIGGMYDAYIRAYCRGTTEAMVRAAREMNFFLGLDKQMRWVKEIF